MELELDGTKINLYHDRIRAWARGERIAPITIDMALTTSCNMRCIFCYGQLQKNTNKIIKKQHMTRFLEDAADIGVQGISLVSDGESSISPAFTHSIQYGSRLGLAMATGTNAYLVKGKLLEDVLPHLTYLRVNISAGEESRYNEIMGAHGDMYSQVCKNIESMVAMKQRGDTSCTIGMQMVLMPEFVDQVLPLSRLAINLGVDYLIIKHCSDDEEGRLGVNYGGYAGISKTLEKAESLSTDRTRIIVKWSKINECDSNGTNRSYSQCYGVPFIIQLSGTGLVAPCGMLFHERYKSYHMGNITESSFKSIWQSDRYWEVIRHLASKEFDAKTQCGSLCLQHSVNKYLDAYMNHGMELIDPTGKPPLHKEFI